MTSWDLRQDDDVKLFGLELKSKDIDQTDLHHLIPQNSLSETCNIGMTSWDLRQDDDVKLFGLELKSKDIDQTGWQI